jgi:hypothetical protein
MNNWYGMNKHEWVCIYEVNGKPTEASWQDNENNTSTENKKLIMTNACHYCREPGNDQECKKTLHTFISAV